MDTSSSGRSACLLSSGVSIFESFACGSAPVCRSSEIHSSLGTSVASCDALGEELVITKRTSHNTYFSTFKTGVETVISPAKRLLNEWLMQLMMSSNRVGALQGEGFRKGHHRVHNRLPVYETGVRTPDRAQNRL